ncbi:SRPBCC family protein [uncultured Oscillibacter sp.]|uniref:SRPBCC family protein n=1 Tax=uncultured Oscillibacter sp. TaxID=876091 RepID=UPI0025EFFC96|nr:SRPBCC family protein [uncultured Oscillibacter sp.]
MATAKMEGFFPYPRERVWAAVTDLSDWRWRSDLKGLEVTGPDTFVEYAADGTATRFAVRRREEPGLWAFEMENGNMAGCWTGRFADAPGGCTAAFTEEVQAKRVWMRPFVGWYLRSQQRRYWADLRRRLEALAGEK